MNKDELMTHFGEFLKTVPQDKLTQIVGFQPTDDDLLREKAFAKWQEILNATNHASGLGGKARVEAVSAWHRLMGEFDEHMGKLDRLPIPAVNPAIETAPPNTAA